MKAIQVTELESVITKMEEEKTSSTARAAELAALQDKSIVSGDLIKRVSQTQGNILAVQLGLGHSRITLYSIEMKLFFAYLLQSCI